MTRSEILASEYANDQCGFDCRHRQSDCHKVCEEFNICRLDFLAGYQKAENEISRIFNSQFNDLQ